MVWSSRSSARAWLLGSVAALCALLTPVAPALAADAHAPVPSMQKWSFWGPFGKYDRAQLQRGFKVYREVCQNCHGLSLLSFRDLAEAGGPGFSSAQAATVAAEYKITDGPNDAGEMFERPGRLADRFPKPFANTSDPCLSVKTTRITLFAALCPSSSRYLFSSAPVSWSPLVRRMHGRSLMSAAQSSAAPRLRGLML